MTPTTPTQPATKRANGQKSQPVATGKHEPAKLVTYQPPRKFRALGGAILEQLSEAGFDVHARAVKDFPRSCSGGHQLKAHTLELAPGVQEIPIAEALASAANLGLKPACGCEFGETILHMRREKKTVEAAEALPDATFFTVITSAENGGEVMATASSGQIHAIRSTGVMRRGMVLILVSDR